MEYQWRAKTIIYGDGDPRNQLTAGSSAGAEGEWQTTSEPSGSRTFDYWYHDANVMVGGVWTDANSSRVVVNVTTDWEVRFDRNNAMWVTVNNRINYIVRIDVVGQNTDTPGRVISIHQYEGGPALATFTDVQLTQVHDITREVKLSTFDFEVAPGGGDERPSLYLHNQAMGYPSWDVITMGVSFRNPNPGPILYELRYEASGASNVPANQSYLTAEPKAGFRVSSQIPTVKDGEWLGWADYPGGPPVYQGGEWIELTSANPVKTIYGGFVFDYRPGQRKINGVWESHNRRAGACDRIGYGTMRTEDGGEGTDNPPSLKTNGVWYNQKKIGANQ